MKKLIPVLFLIVLCAGLLAGCGCKHETWNDATCEVPKTCAQCGKTEGEALGHSWTEADCVQPKTCSRCEKTEGAALGHNWTEADCETPKTCQTCAATEGEALGHTWLDATTEAPKTCSACSLTEGERIITDPRFTTAACQELFGSWAMKVPMDGDMLGLEGFTGVLEVNVFMDFTNDGKISISTRIDKPEDFDAALREYMTETIYSDFEASGISREDANAQTQASVGMTIEEYVDALLTIMDFEAIFAALDMEGNYYAADGKLYSGTGWDEEMTPSPYRFMNDKLVVDELIGSFGEFSDGFTRVEKEEN